LSVDLPATGAQFLRRAVNLPANTAPANTAPANTAMIGSWRNSS
jgi:hypothetical protein